MLPKWTRIVTFLVGTLQTLIFITNICLVAVFASAYIWLTKSQTIQFPICATTKYKMQIIQKNEFFSNLFGTENIEKTNKIKKRCKTFISNYNKR